MKKFRVFMGFSETAGYNSNLLEGFSAIGIKVDLYTFGEHKFKYKNDLDKSLFQRYLHYVVSKYQERKKTYILLHVLNKILLFIFALFKYDIFIFSHQGSFLNFFDLPILKFFNKKIIYKFYGSDVRPPYLNGGYFYGNNMEYERIFQMTNKIYNNNKKIAKYADYIINNPATSQLIPSESIINTFCIGNPKDIKINEKSFNQLSKEVSILHAPSLKKEKGSDKIKIIINELKEEGYKINYIEIYNMPNSKVLEKLQECDFVIDEVYSDSPMASFCTEALYCGKPVIIGGYYSNMKKEFKMKDFPPVFYVQPTQIKATIKMLIDDNELRMCVGKEAKEFSYKHNNKIRVANNFVKLFNDEIEQDWLFSPNQISYIYGWGTPKDELKRFLQKYIHEKGEEALFLENSPTLKQRILDFINE